MRHRIHVLVVLLILLALACPARAGAQAPASPPQRLVVFEAFIRAT